MKIFSMKQNIAVFTMFFAIFGIDADQGKDASVPQKKMVVVTCMDTRINPYEVLGIKKGDAHILRNAGGVVTPDVLRSLVLSTHAFDTDKIILIQHTDCGVLGLDEAKIKQDLEKKFDARIPKQFFGFANLKKSVQQGVQNIKKHPFIDDDAVKVQGAILNLSSNKLEPVQ